MRYVSAGLLGLLLVGCGAGPKPVAKAAPHPVEAAEPEVERRPYAETTEAPADALAALDGVYVRFANPEATWGKLPSVVGAMPIASSFKEITSGRVPGMSAALAAVVDPTQPVEMVIADDRTFAYRVRSPDAVLHGAAGLMLHRVATGVWDVEGLAMVKPEQPDQPVDVDSDGAGGASEDYETEMEPPPTPTEPMSCRLMHLPPPVDYRVICADSAAALRKATPFLVSARRVAENTSQEIHVELGGDQYRRFVELARHTFETSENRKKKTAQEQRFDKMFSGVMLSVFDNERVAFDAQFTGNDLELALDLAYRADSTLAPWLDWVKGQRAPQAVRQLPEDSALRMGIAGIGKPAVSELVDDFMFSMDETMVLSNAEKQELRGAITSVAPDDGRFVLALGVDPEAARAALDSDEVRLADEVGKSPGKQAMEHLTTATSQWFTVGVEIDGEKYLQDVKRTMALRHKKARLRNPDEKADRTHSTMNPASTPAGLPPHSLHYVEQITPNPKFVPTPLEPAATASQHHWLMLPDGPRAWIVMAPSLAKAKQLAARVLRSSTPADPKLAPTDAAFLVDLNMWGLEFIGMKVDTKGQRDTARATLARATTVPGHGHLQLPFSLRALPRTDAAGMRLVLQSRLSLADVFSNAMSLVPDPDSPAP